MQSMQHTLLNNKTYQQGFTLVELMISLVLGLLISAAAVQIYLTNARTSTMQKSGSELQDASVFGIQFLENHIRLANLGNAASNITDTTVGGGIVLTPSNIVNATSTPASTTVLTNSTGDTGWTGVSNTNVGSDQLTIQFTNTTGSTISDCEGADIETNATVIERYFLRAATVATNGLVLACDAERVTETGSITNFGGAGQEFITNVDQFKVLLGTQTIADPADSSVVGGQLAYISPNAYKVLPKKSAIMAIKVGMIVRGSTAIVGTDGRSTFSVLGNTNTLKSGVDTKRVRTTYESTTLLRNARIVNVSTSLSS